MRIIRLKIEISNRKYCAKDKRFGTNFKTLTEHSFNHEQKRNIIRVLIGRKREKQQRKVL